MIHGATLNEPKVKHQLETQIKRAAAESNPWRRFGKTRRVFIPVAVLKVPRPRLLPLFGNPAAAELEEKMRVIQYRRFTADLAFIHA
jgi:hypothetical protein